MCVGHTANDVGVGDVRPISIHTLTDVHVLADLMGGGLSGIGLVSLPTFGDGNHGGNGFIITAYHIPDFVDVEHYVSEVNQLYQRVRASQPAKDVDSVLVPGIDVLLTGPMDIS